MSNDIGKGLAPEAVRALSAKLAKGIGKAATVKPNVTPRQNISDAATFAVSQPVQLIISKLREHFNDDNAVRETKPGQWEARCPAHDDKRASLSIHQGEGGKAVLHDHAGCSPAEVCAELGLRFNDLFPHKNKGDAGRIVAEYDYCDEQGTLLYQVCRFDPKDFRQRRPNGKGGWVWNLQGVRRVLYRLPELIGADPAAWVLVCEGEKDVDRLRAAGLIATCNVGGAGKWRTEYAEFFKGRRVCIVADKDTPGRKHGQQVAKALTGTATEVRIIECPGDKMKDASDYFDSGGTAETLIQLVEQAPIFDASQVSITAPIGDDCPYEITPAGILWAKPSRDGQIPTLLSNFTAQIAAEVERDDGAECERQFQVEAVLNDRKCTFAIPASRFAAMNWPVEHLGAEAVIFASQTYKDHARVAIQLCSPRPIPRRTTFVHTGWRKLGDEWVYLHASGAVGASGRVEGVAVELPAMLALYEMPDPPTGEALQSAIRASLAMLDLGPDSIIVPLFCAVWRVTLGPCDFGLHLSGASSVFKSESAALMQQFFGPGLDARHLPGSWSSTDNALEGMLFAAKDTLAVIDDFAPSGGSHDIARWHSRADRVIRAQGNNSARARMRADGSLRPAKPPRGMVVSTGEDVPRGQSLRARMLIVEVSKGDIASGTLTRCQRDARNGLYASAMSGFLCWLASRYEQVRQGFRTEVEQLRSEALGTAAHCRTPEITANLALGLRYFIAFAKDSGAMSETEGQALWQRGWKALGDAAAAQAGHQTANEPAARFLELLRAAIVAGRAHLADRDGNVPPNAERWGWRLLGNTRPIDWQPQGDRVGWVDDETVYLDPDASYRASQSMAESGDGLSISARTLRKRLAEKHMLILAEKDRLTVTRRLQGTDRDVLGIPLATLMRGESGFSGDSGSTRILDPASGDRTPILPPENLPDPPVFGVQNRGANGAGGPENGVVTRIPRIPRKRLHIPPPVYRGARH